MRTIVLNITNKLQSSELFFRSGEKKLEIEKIGDIDITKLNLHMVSITNLDKIDIGIIDTSNKALSGSHSSNSIEKLSDKKIIYKCDDLSKKSYMYFTWEPSLINGKLRIFIS